VLQTFIDEVKLDLSFVNFVSFNKPKIFSSVKIFSSSFSLFFLFASTNIGNCSEPMCVKDSCISRVSAIIHYSEESVFIGNFITVLDTCHFIVYADTFIATTLDGKQCDNIVGSWILQHELSKFGLRQFILTCNFQLRK
jgi:hypothetical protein